MNKKRLLRNTIWEFTSEFITIIVGVMIPRYVILVFGSEVNGLTSTIKQTLDALSILQVGVMSSAIFLLYKPIYSSDFNEISRIMSIATKLYRKIGVIFILVSILVAPAFTLSIKTSIEKIFIIAAFFIMSMKNVLEFFFTSKYRMIFNASQRNYLICMGQIIETIIYNLTIISILISGKHFILMYVGLPLGCITKILFLEITYRKIFGNKIFKCHIEKNVKLPNRGYVFFSEISYSIVTTSISIIISIYYNLEYSSIYSIYAMVIAVINVALGSIYKSFGPSFGNLIASGNTEKIVKTFRMFQIVILAFGVWMYTCSAFWIIPFVNVYTVGMATNYVDHLLGFLIIMYGYFYCVRIPSSVFISSSGLFKNSYKLIVASAVISLLISIIIGRLRAQYILLGPVFFYISLTICQEFVISRNMAKYSSKNWSIKVLLGTLAILTSFALFEKTKFMPSGIFAFMGLAFIFAVICAIIIALLVWIFDRPTFSILLSFLKMKSQEDNK